jgi:hypothetical protein
LQVRHRTPPHAIRGRRGTFKAVGAIGHDILIAHWHIVSAHIATRTTPRCGTASSHRRDQR